MSQTMLDEPQNDDTQDTLVITIDEDHIGKRLDKALADICPDYSRTRLQGLIDAGECLVNGQTCTTSSRKVEMHDTITLSLSPLEDADPEAENIPLDIVFEDNDLLVINKPAGMVVHPAVGHRTGTLVNALLYHCGDSLSGINGVKRPGIVHRLDKDTSGLMMVAKNDFAHHALSEQLQDRSLSRVYLALVLGVPFPPKGRVETLIGRHPANRLKMAVVTKGGREAITNYAVIKTYHTSLFSLVECRLETGRTHQIRVHMDHTGFPIIGDPLYGAEASKIISRLKKSDYDDGVKSRLMQFPRQALHATSLSFIHPRSEEAMSFDAGLPADMDDLLSTL
jgi:23S rRNA pseudouridine1911/1915/1917 synthase